MHHLSCLRVDKDSKNENIYFYTAEYHENMTNLFHHYFLHFDYIMRPNPFDFLEFKWLNSHNFYKLCRCKDLGEV